MREQLAGQVSAPKQAILRGLCSQINDAISSAEDRLQNIDLSVERLINPRPVTAESAKEIASPPASSLESELQAILRRLERFRALIEDTASTLQSAV